MISSNTIIFVCIIIKAEAILAENEADQRELFAIENSLHELRTCSQSLDNGRVPEFCYTRQSPRANELSRKSRSFWEMRGQDEQCLKTPCSRKSHKITTKVIFSKNPQFCKKQHIWQHFQDFMTFLYSYINFRNWKCFWVDGHLSQSQLKPKKQNWDQTTRLILHHAAGIAGHPTMLLDSKQLLQ